jgi:hypothetical protein
MEDRAMISAQRVHVDASDARRRFHCSLCGARLRTAIEVSRKAAAPVKRGCLGGDRRIRLCDGCAQAVADILEAAP